MLFVALEFFPVLFPYKSWIRYLESTSLDDLKLHFLYRKKNFGSYCTNHKAGKSIEFAALYEYVFSTASAPLFCSLGWGQWEFCLWVWPWIMKNALHQLQCFYRPPGAMARMVIQGRNELRSNTHDMHSSCCSPPFSGLVTVKLQPLNNTLSTLSKFKDAVPKEEARASWFRASQLEQNRHSQLGVYSACAEPSSARGGGTQPWQRVREGPNYIIVGMHPNVPKWSLCFFPARCEITRKRARLAKWREDNLAGRCDCWHDPLGKHVSSALWDVFISVVLCT